MKTEKNEDALGTINNKRKLVRKMKEKFIGHMLRNDGLQELIIERRIVVRR